MNYNVYMVGVGGQGVLTIGEILLEAAYSLGLPVNFYPTEGMAQRGGFVKAQLRIGRKAAGANLPEQGADLAVSMEVSESLKAVRYIRPGGVFVLWGHVWAPTAVMLGKAGYPELTTVQDRIREASARLVYLDPGLLPLHEGEPVADNIFTLGAAVAASDLKTITPPETVKEVLAKRWPKAAARNLTAFQAGFEAALAGETA